MRRLFFNFYNISPSLSLNYIKYANTFHYFSLIRLFTVVSSYLWNYNTSKKILLPLNFPANPEHMCGGIFFVGIFVRKMIVWAHRRPEVTLNAFLNKTAEEIVKGLKITSILTVIWEILSWMASSCRKWHHLLARKRQHNHQWPFWSKVSKDFNFYKILRCHAWPS